MTDLGLSNALLRQIKATIALEGCWNGRSDVMENIMLWRIKEAGEVRDIVVSVGALDKRD